MKKILATLAVIMALVCISAVPALANDGTSTMYTTVRAALRNAPNGSVLYTVEPGQEIICYRDRDATNQWQHCFYDNHANFAHEGWIKVNQLSSVRNGNNGGGQNNSLNGTYNTTMYTSGSCNFRNGPSMTSDIIGQVPANAPIFVYQITDGWAEIDYGNTHGYISTDFLGDTAPAPAPTPAPSDVSWAYQYNWSTVYNFNDYCNLNQDIARTFGNNPNGAFEHFIRFGMNEGRQASKSWNILSYALANPHLIDKFGSYYPAYYMSACNIPIH